METRTYRIGRETVKVQLTGRTIETKFGPRPEAKRLKGRKTFPIMPQHVEICS